MAYWLTASSCDPLSQQRGSPWLSALEILHNKSCFLELSGVGYYVLTRLVLPGSSQVVIIIVVT